MEPRLATPPHDKRARAGIRGVGEGGSSCRADCGLFQGALWHEYAEGGPYYAHEAGGVDEDCLPEELRVVLGRLFGALSQRLVEA